MRSMEALVMLKFCVISPQRETLAKASVKAIYRLSMTELQGSMGF